MSELLRNSREMITPYDGKPFKANNPEEYITRLHHFSSGLGFTPEHLTSGRNPAFTSKNVSFEQSDGDPKYDVNVRSNYAFDEGMVPYGVSQAANDALYEGDNWSDKGYLAGREVRHRTGMSIDYDSHGRRGVGSDRFHSYVVSKDFNNNNPETSRLDDLVMERLENTPEKAKNAIEDVSNNFRDFNKSRVIDSRVSSLANEAIANPHPRRIAHTLRNYPGNMGPQFLGVATFKPGGPSGHRSPLIRSEDYIDLHTGTWAKLDPDGYFPD